jgi:hypothetical protein
LLFGDLSVESRNSHRDLLQYFGRPLEGAAVVIDANACDGTTGRCDGSAELRAVGLFAASIG